MNGKIARAIVMLAGLTAVLIAILAKQLGIDHNDTWGVSRIAVGLGGSILISASAAFFLSDSRALRAVEAFRFMNSSSGPYFQVGLVMVIVIIIYVWYVSVGLWTIWPKSTFSYDLLASSFQHGQVALEEKPDPALLALPDPYDIASRGQIRVLWDASLYNGKYYLYFGPAPALLLLAVKILLPRQIADQYLVFAFVAGLFIFMILLIVSFWQRFFPRLPKWTLMLGLLMGGLASPSLWLLSRPAVYEAAIASSQFFFIGGFYFSFTALSRQPSPIWRLILAGFFWACAIGSRTTIVVPVAFMLLMLVWWILKYRRPDQTVRETGTKLAALALPVIIGSLCLTWYNWARFGSVFELGFRYQLTWINLHMYLQHAFSPAYVLQNLRTYLITPPNFVHTFPFFKPQLVLNPAATQMMPALIYHPEAVTGLLYGAPFLLLAAIPFASLFSRNSPRLLSSSPNETNADRGLLTWTSVSLLGSALLSFALLLVFFYATMRYLEDVVPCLILLSSLGLWQGYRFFQSKPALLIGYLFAATALAGYSIASSLLLAVTGYEQRFQHLNHALLNQLIRMFGR